MAETPITMAGNLPRDEKYNGLKPLEEDLIEDPQRIRRAVIAYDVDHTTYKTDSGKTTPTVRIRWIEPAGGEHEEEVVKLLERLAEDRLGTLPLSSAEEDGEGQATG